MIRRIEKEKKQQYIKHKILQHNREIYVDDFDDGESAMVESDEKSYDVIKDFENLLTRKREKNKKHED